MQLIGLTGGIASGKSTIGKRLAELGAVRIDADQLARDAVSPGSPGLARIVERFGKGVLRNEDGSDDGTELDRAALGQIVFLDSGALADLNAIVHPEVHRLFSEALAAAQRANPETIVVYEIPLLAETGRTDDFDRIVVADAPAEMRVRRMVEQRGMSEDDARARIANQTGDAERRAIADVLIDTSGSLAQTLHQTDTLWRSLNA